MGLLEKIRSSFTAQLTLWVAGFVIAISVVVIMLLARFSEKVIRDEVVDTTQQTLENTALRISHAISQAEIVAHLEHRSFKLDKSYVENLLEERKPQQLSDIKVIDSPKGVGQRSFTKLTVDGAPAYSFYEPVNGTPYGLVITTPTKAIFHHFLGIQRVLLLVSVLGVLMLTLLCWLVIVRHLRPLRQLATSAQRIAAGHLDEPIPHTSHRDEISKLQNALAKMQHSLNSYLEEIPSKQAMLSMQNAELQEAYSEAHEYDELKSKFISEMTKKMTVPVKKVCQNTETICNEYATLTASDMSTIQVDILSATEEVTLLLDQLLNNSSQSGIYEVSSDNTTSPAT